MRRHTTRPWATLLVLVLTLSLVACDGESVEDDPRGALRDAVMAFRDYEGIELTIGAQLDEAAEASARDEGDFTEEELALLTDSTLTVRGVEGEDDEQGQSEFVVVVGDEAVLTVRALPDYELYALIDLPAIERVADSLDAGDDFEQSIAEFEQTAGLFGLGQVASAAREADWIRVAGLQQMIEMAEEEQPEEDEELDEADLEALTREVGERLLDFLEDEDVAVEHLGSEEIGERVRLTATGEQLRELALDLLEPFDEVAGDAADATGAGMGIDELRSELEEGIPDDLRVSLDAWIDDGELSQVAVDVFELARAAETEQDVPDGEFLIAIGIAEFAGTVEAPDADVTFDVFEIFGNMLGELGGDLGEGVPDEGLDELPEDGELELGDDFCLSEEEVAGFLEQLPEDQRDLDDDEIEAMLGLPVC